MRCCFLQFGGELACAAALRTNTKHNCHHTPVQLPSNLPPLSIRILPTLTDAQHWVAVAADFGRLWQQ